MSYSGDVWTQGHLVVLPVVVLPVEIRQRVCQFASIQTLKTLNVNVEEVNRRISAFVDEKIARLETAKTGMLKDQFWALHKIFQEELEAIQPGLGDRLNNICYFQFEEFVYKKKNLYYS